MTRLPTWAATWKIILYHPLSYAGTTVLYLLSYGTLALPGLVLQRIFDHLSGSSPAGPNTWTLLGLLFAAEVAHIVSDCALAYPEETFRGYGWELLRGNIVLNALKRPGGETLAVAPGDAINRLHHDVGELADWPSWLPYVAGQVLLAIIAVVTMALTAPLLTLIAGVPLVIVVVVVRAGRERLLRHVALSRQAGSEITGFLGEVLDGIVTVKNAVAEKSVVARLTDLNEVRRRAEVQFSVLLALLNWAHTGSSEIILGLVLLLAGTALRRETLTVGDFVLFVSYLRLVVDVPAGLGGFLADYQTQAVSIDRLQELQPDAPPSSLVAPLPNYMRRTNTEVVLAAEAHQPLRTLTVHELSYHYPGNDRAVTGTGGGIEGIGFEMGRGELVVITGKIGSGKTTLLRTMLGLLPMQDGEIRWNGKIVRDPTGLFRPPHSAFTPQVPRLFSDTLRNNILLGLPEASVDLDTALYLAVLEADLRELQEGLDTLVGPRGMRLSGGQVQRAAAARMFVRRPDLLVLDDVSSALDVETEQALWDRLLRLPDVTCLAVSHRPAVLQRADRVIVLKDGRIEAFGEPEMVLRSSSELQQIWQHAESPHG